MGSARFEPFFGERRLLKRVLMPIMCRVPGCSNPADFKVHVFDRYANGPDRPSYYYAPDEQVPHICHPHAVVNGLNSDHTRNG
jgi:hypothetical protein